MVTRRLMLAMPFAIAASGALARNNERVRATLYKTPDCGCCEGYARYLRRNGFDVTTVPSHDLPLIRKQHGVPEKLEGCHTTVIGDYVIEGHVPIGPVKRLLRERPAIKGISLPGMPEGSPGMTGRKQEPFVIYEIAGEGTKVYARE
jgi:hypothetical protein